MTAKHRITVNLDDSEYQELQRIAEGTDRSLAWLGRQAICDFIKQRERKDVPLLTEIGKASGTTGQSLR